MKKSEIENYLRKKISLANRPTHEDVRNAMKFAYNSGSKKYKIKAKGLGKMINEQDNLNQAIAKLITELHSKTKEVEVLAQSYLGMLPKDKGCKNWNEMQKKFAKEILKIVTDK